MRGHPGGGPDGAGAPGRRRVQGLDPQLPPPALRPGVRPGARSGQGLPPPPTIFQAPNGHLCPLGAGNTF